jgi:hypothetical protein
VSDVEVKFETKVVFAVRGFEARTRTKWENQGWDFVAQDKGGVRTKLSFRRPQPKVNWLVVSGLGALVAGGIGFAIFMGSIEGQGSLTAGDEPAATAPSETPADESANEPNYVAPEILTIENNADLAALLASEGDNISMNQAFFDRYNGASIEFDGNIGYVANLEGDETLFDVLVLVDDYSETSAIGPMFRVLNVNYGDFNLSGENVPDSITMGMNVRIVGKVVDWDESALTFEFEIISTEVR